MQLRAQARQKVDIAINDGESCETDSKRVASKAKTSKTEVIRQKHIQVAITISPLFNHRMFVKRRSQDG